MRAACNIIGPDGELVLTGAEIPTHWPGDFLAALVASGGAEPGEDLPAEPASTVALNADTQLPQPAPEPLELPQDVADPEVTPPPRRGRRATKSGA